MTLGDLRARTKLPGDEILLVARELGIWPMDADRPLTNLEESVFRLGSVLAGLGVLSPATRAIALGVLYRRVLPDANWVANAGPDTYLRLADREYLADGDGYLHLPTGQPFDKLPNEPVAREIYSLSAVYWQQKGMSE